MRVVIVARASTQEQNQSIKIQLEALRNWAYLMGHQVVCEFFALESGKLTKRDTVEDALEVIRLGQAEALVVTKLDRLGRDMGELIRIIKEIQQMQAGFVSVEQNIDTTSVMGKFFFQMMGAVAELERDMISERVKTGVRQAKKEGKRVGAPAFWFDVVKGTGEVIPDDKQLEVIEQIYQLRFKGITFEKIATGLNARQIPTKKGLRWTRQGVRDMIAKYERYQDSLNAVS
jgi:site-specific DNA recombinase